MAASRAIRCAGSHERSMMTASGRQRAAGRDAMTHALRASIVLATVLVFAPTAIAQKGEKWATSWAASVQGPYPVGNPSAQPNQKFAFPSPEAGARDQTFRLVVLPDIWGKQARLRFSNAFGTKPVTIDGVFAGLQHTSATLVTGSNRPVTFGGKLSA